MGGRRRFQPDPGTDCQAGYSAMRMGGGKRIPEMMEIGSTAHEPGAGALR